MKFFEHVDLQRIQTFLPQSLIPTKPKFFVWFTGTLGQAEWLISHSKHLRGNALPLPCPKSPGDQDVPITWDLLPIKLKPLMSLEQPDLMITDDLGNPLISIEITEQQPVGLNAQQRMARFWSAVANRIPCAYLLPIEGYQLDKAPPGAIKAFEERDQTKKMLALRVAQLPKLKPNLIQKLGAKNISELERLIQNRQISLRPDDLQEFQDHVDKHLTQKGEVIHVPEVSVAEYVHKVGTVFQKAYIRKAGIPGSMLLAWFKLCNEIVTSAAFQLPVSYKNLFRTNGRIHTIEDSKNPHLSYRNLPPAPGTNAPLNLEGNDDEIALFFKMLDSVLGKEKVENIRREDLTKPGEFYSDKHVMEQQLPLKNISQFDQYGSKDFIISSRTFESLLESKECTNLEQFRAVKSHYLDFHLYKIFCDAKSARPISDPYSGALAVRDILFTRDLDSLATINLLDFKRKNGLVLWVDLLEKASLSHKFLAKKVDDVYTKHFGKGKEISTQQKIITIIKELEAGEVPKDFRAHILFSDLIVVRHKFNKDSNVEIFLGIPSLLRLGFIDQKAKFLRSLRIE